MEIKQHMFLKMSQRWNHKINSKITSDEWKQEHNISELTDVMKSLPREKFIAVSTCVKKEWSQTNNQSYHLKNWKGTN